MTDTEIRQRASIQILPKCVEICNDILLRGGSLEESSLAKQATVMAVQYADALVAELAKKYEAKG